MATNPTPQQALEAARRAHDARLTAVRVLAEARQNLTDVREATTRAVEAAKAKAVAEVGVAEIADVKAWDAALRAGWQVTELRRIGFAEADKRARVRRRRTAVGPTSAPTSPVSAPTTKDDDRAREKSPQSSTPPALGPAGAHHD